MWVGKRFDWLGYEKAKKERWEDLSNQPRLTNQKHCKVHDVFFDLEDEPCWQCVQEFEETL